MKYMELTKKQNDLVTIVVPAHNAEVYLKENIEAILGQTYKNLEVIYICDGCTDRTVEILETYQNDSRLKVVVQKENQGAAISRNIGMEMATGDWIIFWDADDLFAPEMIEVMVNRASDAGADVAECCWELFAETPVIERSVEDEWRKLWCISYPVMDVHKENRYVMQVTDTSPCTKLVNKSIYKKTEVHFQNIPNANDAYYSKVSFMNADKIVFVERRLLYYRSNIGRTTISTARTERKNYLWEAYNKIYEYVSAEEKFLKSFYNDALRIVLLCSEESSFVSFVAELRDKYFEMWGMNNEGIESHLNLINRTIYRKIRAGEGKIEKAEIYKFARIEFLKNISRKECSIWGTGALGEEVLDNIKETDIKFKHVFDSSSDKWGMDFHGYSIEKFEGTGVDNIIVTTSRYYDEIRKMIGNRAGHVYNLEYEIGKIPE